MRLIVVQECLLMSVLNQSYVRAASVVRKVTMWFTGYWVVSLVMTIDWLGVSCLWVGKSYCMCVIYGLQLLTWLDFSIWNGKKSHTCTILFSHTCTILFLLELIRSVCLWWWLEMRLGGFMLYNQSLNCMPVHVWYCNIVSMYVLLWSRAAMVTCTLY